MPDELDRFLDQFDLETDLEDVQLDKAQIRQLASIRRLIRREGDRIMASVADVQAAADAAVAAQAVTLAAIADLATRVQALIDSSGGSINPADLDPIVAELTTIASTEASEGAAVGAIDPAPAP